jgi:hypothetical protein
MTSLLQRLAQNFPFTFNLEEATKNLEDTGFYRLVLPELKRKEFLHDLSHFRLGRLLKRLKSKE